MMLLRLERHQTYTAIFHLAAVAFQANGTDGGISSRSVSNSPLHVGGNGEGPKPFEIMAASENGTIASNSEIV